MWAYAFTHRSPCICAFAAHAGICETCHTPYTCSFAACVGISLTHRTPCTCSSADHADISLTRHTPCTCSSPAHVGISPTRRTPCTGSSAAPVGNSLACHDHMLRSSSSHERILRSCVEARLVHPLQQVGGPWCLYHQRCPLRQRTLLPISTSEDRHDHVQCLDSRPHHHLLDRTSHLQHCHLHHCHLPPLDQKQMPTLRHRDTSKLLSHTMSTRNHQTT